MKNRVILTGILGIVGIGSMACGGAATNNSNGVRNSNVNANTSSINSAVNTASNAVSTVANTVANTAAAIVMDSPGAFVAAAAQGGMAEVELGKLAEQKSQNAEVKAFAKMMVADHTKLNADVKAFAAKKKFELPADMGSHKSTLDDLNKTEAANFDKDYVDAMVEDHEDDVAAFQKQADSSPDVEVKAFAAKALPVLKGHLEKIKAIQTKMNK